MLIVPNEENFLLLFVCMSTVKRLLLIAGLFCSQNVAAQSVDKDPAAIVEIGAAASRSVQDHLTSYGPTVAVEVTPIDNWLELEVGVTPLFNHGLKEWSADLLFKKPWTLSSKTEFMIGLGPEWVRERGTNSLSLEGVLDFMFWPSAKHKFGWYVEPGYEYNFARGHDRSIGISGGLLIAIR
jgi:hypothetical protein